MVGDCCSRRWLPLGLEEVGIQEKRPGFPVHPGATALQLRCSTELVPQGKTELDPQAVEVFLVNTSHKPALWEKKRKKLILRTPLPE